MYYPVAHLSRLPHNIKHFKILHQSLYQSSIIVHCFELSSSPLFCFCQSVSQSVTHSLSFYLSSLLLLFLTCTHFHIAQVPLGKLLSLPMNSAMLLLSLDPKGNIMNNEQRSDGVSGRVGWGDGQHEREREGGGRPFRTKTKWRNGGRATC